MKFLKLEVENIASLKGKHSIDFSCIYETSSLFAITGDTGSGKSTLLNAISLSLYGQNYKKSLNQLDFITLNEAYASTSIEIEVDNKNYRFNWSCRIRKRNGELLKTPKPKREFFEYKNDKWEVIEKSSEEIIQLSFEQFCKTIILNQGDFAKFLTSSFKERKDILEKFYEGFNLDLLSIQNRKKLNLVKEKISLIESKISGFDQSNTESLEKTVLEKEIEVLTKQSAKTKDLLEESFLNKNHLLDILKTKALIQTSLDRKARIELENNSATAQLNSEKMANKVILKKVEKIKKEFAEKEPKLLEAIKMKQQIHDIERDFKKTLSELAHIEKTLLELRESISKNLSEQDLLDKELESLRSKIGKVIDLNDFEIKISRLVEIKNKIELISVDTKNLDNKRGELTVQANEKKEKINAQSLEIINIDSDKAKRDIEKEELYITSINDHLKEQEQNKKLISDLNDEQTELSVSKLKLEDKQSQSKKELNDMTERLGLFVDRVELNQLQLAKEKCYEHSIEKKECIICGNKDLNSFKVLSSKENSTNISNTKNQIEVLEKSKLENIKEFERNKEKLSNINKTIDKNNQTKVELIASSDGLKSQKELKDRLSTSRTKIDQLRKEVSDKIFLDESIKENQKQLEQLRERYKEVNQHFKDKNKHLNILKEEDSALLYEVKQLTSLDLSLNSYQDELLILRRRENIKNVLAEKKISFSEIEKTKNNYHSSLLKKQKYSSELIKNKDLLSNKINAITLTDDPELILSQIKSTVEKSHNELEASTKTLTELRIKKSDIDSRLKSALEQIESSIDMINTLVTEFEANTYLESQEKTENELSLMNKAFCKLNHYHKINFEVLKETKNKFLEAIQSNKNLYAAMTENLTRKTTQYKQLLDIEIKIKELKQSSKDLYKKKSSLENLYEIIGRDEFRNFVLSNIENNLIIQTNIELSHLCDERYEIVQYKKAIKNAPEFYIIDKYKAGLQRKVSTLSGGETFMVSLAMALALSELTRGTRQIDSLFIDEGFGTLDNESLEDVINMLLNMSLRGKTIGLITHVQKLSNRIPVNINLIKSQQGSSSIKLLYH